MFALSTTPSLISIGTLQMLTAACASDAALAPNSRASESADTSIVTNRRALDLRRMAITSTPFLQSRLVLSATLPDAAERGIYPAPCQLKQLAQAESLGAPPW